MDLAFGHAAEELQGLQRSHDVDGDWRLLPRTAERAVLRAVRACEKMEARAYSGRGRADLSLRSVTPGKPFTPGFV
eukprot:3268483-Alexandrium_andersonii.AAC.1